MDELSLLAFDYGASGGRAMLGGYRDGKLTLRTVHRFANRPVSIGGHLHWDFPELLAQLKRGLSIGWRAAAGRLASVGIDTWGVDYGLLDADGKLLGPPYHYRDRRTAGLREDAFAAVPPERIYETTGIASLPFNTIYQLLAAKARTPEVLDRAETMLMMPDLLGYFLTGEKLTEYTIATTSQLVDVRRRDWSWELIRALGLPEWIFTTIVQPGRLRAKLTGDICEQLAIGPVELAAVAGHDTASAVVAVPLTDDNAAYLSTGTWSLLGVEVDRPVITADARRWKFTNEGGTDGRYRLLRNIAGLWLLQECKRHWDAAGQGFEYAELARMAESCDSCGGFIDPDADVFLNPVDMPAAIRRQVRNSGQRPPEGIPQIVRCIFESLAMKYRWVLARLETLLGRTISCLHVVGGGSNNIVLNRFIASAIGRPVICGPTEATAVGNLMMQARALGAVDSLAEIRRVVAGSFPITRFEPESPDGWLAGYERFSRLVGDGPAGPDETAGAARP